MTCISLFFWWYAATFDPAPMLVARFSTQDACRQWLAAYTQTAGHLAPWTTR